MIHGLLYRVITPNHFKSGVKQSLTHTVFRVLGMKKASIDNLNTKILIFEYFPKMSSEINSTRPYSPYFGTQQPLCIFF